MTKITDIKTLGELKKSAYKSRSVKDELRQNLIAQLQKQEGGFEGIIGFEDTVIPDLQTAIFQDIIFYCSVYADRPKHVLPG